MILDMLKGFDKFYSKYGDTPIIDNYNMKSGTYIKVDENGVKDILFIKQDAKESDFNETDAKLYTWFKERDYNSILPLYDTNKAVKSKVIHSNNLLTLFIKKKNVFKKGQLIDKILIDIDNYFEKIKGFLEQDEFAKEYGSNKPKLKIYELSPKVNSKLFTSSLRAIKKSVKEEIEHIDLLEDLEDDDYIRIFYDTKIENYRNEYKRYMIRKVFNKDKYHVIVNNNVVGVPSVDIATNPNKPSLELKTMKTTVPLRMTFEDALLRQKLYDFMYFYNIPKYIKEKKKIEKVHGIFKTLYIPTSWDIEDRELTEYTGYEVPMHFVRTGMGTSFSIVDYDLIPPFNNIVDFKFDNILEKKYRNEVTGELEDKEYDNIHYLSDLEKTIDFYLFNYKLTKNYFNDDIKMDSGFISKNMVNILYLSKKPFYEWFRKGNTSSIISIIDRVTAAIVEENFKSGQDYYRLIDIMNLRISLLKYFNKGGNELHQSIKDIREKINSCITSPNIYDLENDDEFFYLAGQLAYYFTTKSQQDVKMQNINKPFLVARDIDSLKNIFMRQYEKYSYAIRNSDIRFKNAFKLVSSYYSDAKFKNYKDLFLAGYLSKNLIFYKKSKMKGSRENEK